MRRKYTLGIACAAAAITTGVLVIAGCGGGGSLVTPPNNPPAGFTHTAEFLKLLPDGQAGATEVGNAVCFSCHAASSGAKQLATRAASAQVARTRAVSPAHPIDTDKYALTKHGQKGVTCEQCHGAGSNHVSWANGFLANPSSGNALDSYNNVLAYPKLTSFEVCAQCHTKQATEFRASKHMEPVEDVVGAATPSTTCFRCHSGPTRTQFISYPLAHGATPAAIDASILALSATQWKTLQAASEESPSCGSCHDPHMPTGNLVQKVGGEAEEKQLIYQVANMDTSTIGPSAPVATYSTTNQTCGTCHNSRGANPSDATLSGASSTTRPSMHDGPQFNMLLGIGGVEGAGIESKQTAHVKQNSAQCVQCHMPDVNGSASHAMVVNTDVSCSPCHSAADATARSAAVKDEIQSSLYAIRNRMANWATTKFSNSYWWDYTGIMPTGVTPPTAAQEATVPLAVRQARHNYYFVLRDGSSGIHNTAYARLLINKAMTALDTVVGRAASVDPQPTKAQIQSILQSDRLRARAGEKLAL